MNPQRCRWATSDPLIDYHDHEWGVPQHDDRALFEFLVLEGAQAGLSWETILKKRAAYRTAFDAFSPKIVAGYSTGKIAELLQNPGIVRNRLKIQSAILNAQAFLRVQEEFRSFSDYLWPFVGNQPVFDVNLPWRHTTHTEVSNTLSKDLRRRGFKFVGTTICYAYMQAIGMVNDHEPECFRRQEVAGTN